jgi:hypothetical protein
MANLQPIQTDSILDSINSNKQAKLEVVKKIEDISEEIDELEDIMNNPYELDIYKYKDQTYYDKVISFDLKSTLENAKTQSRHIERQVDEISRDMDSSISK